MNDLLKLLIKAMRAVDIFVAAKSVAESEWVMIEPDLKYMKTEKDSWVEERTIYLVRSLKAEINS